MTNKNIPTLRFSEFNNEWVKKKIVDFGEIVTGSTPSTKVEEYYANYGIPWVTPTDIEKEITINSNKYLSDIGAEVARIVPENSILVTSIASIGKNTILGVRGSFNQQINAVIPKREYSPYFLFSQSQLWSKKMKNLAASGTMQIINKTEFSNLDFYVPASEEQSAIGSLFQSLDELLAAYKDNLANYQAFKVSMLSKMFPKAGQTTPEIRLEGFDGEWRQEKLSSIVAIIGGGTPSTSTPEYWDGDINWFSPTEIGESVYAVESEKKITQLGLEKSSAKILPAGKTILFTSRAGIGDAAILRTDSTTNQGFQSLVLDDNTDIYFLYSQKESIKKYALKHAAGSTFLEISGKELGKMPILIPTLKEQQAIGSFFSNLDELILTYQEKIDQLEILKKKLLQGMFI